MKKQFLFLAMFTMALIFAGTNNVFGQLLPGVTDPLGTDQSIPPLSCLATSEPLHPFPGVPYIYSLDGSSGEETAASFTWWATKDMDFITGVVDVTGGMLNTNHAGRLISPDILNVAANYGVTTPAATAGSNEVEITWSANILAGTDYQGLPGPGTPTFVVGYAEGNLCADNIQVYEINPLPNFTIDIAAVNPDDDTTLPWDDITTADDCVDVIQSATYNPATYEVDMDYGTNTFYFEVAAANFVTDWTPTFTLLTNGGLDGLRTTQTAVLELFPTLADAQADLNSLGSNSLTPWDATTSTWATGINLTAATPADAATGVSVFVKVVVTNNTEESLTSNPFVLAVDAQDDTETGIWDMDDADCGIDPATIVADEDDFAAVTITPRPQLDHNTVDTNTAIPNTTVPKPATSANPNF